MHDSSTSFLENRGKLRLAAMTFSIVVGCALLVQGAHLVVKGATAQPSPVAQVAQVDFAKFKRHASVPVPEEEILLNLAEGNLRGGID